MSQAWKDEVTDLARGFAGAFLFAIPLLFTMEMWWIGAFADLWKLVAFLGIAVGANLGLNYFAGFKKGADGGRFVGGAIESVAIGVVASTVVLFVLNRIALGDPLNAVLGKIIIQAVPLSIGASLANVVFQRGESRQGEEQSHAVSSWKATLNDIGATAIGGVFIGISIAPTEEVPMLAAGMDFGHEIALIFLTLLISYMIVFVSEFDKTTHIQPGPAPFQHPITETVLSYVVSLIVAFVALFLFDQIHLGDPLYSTLVQTIVLAVPTTVGGAAGRLAV